MAKYLTAAKLGILPEERKALIAFVDARTLGRIIEVNGHAHYYDQGHAANEWQAVENECGTAGCVAGFVFAHAKAVQGKRKLRGEDTAACYINAATDQAYDEYHNCEPVCPLLSDLYTEGQDHKLAEARKVVYKALRTGRVEW